MLGLTVRIKDLVNEHINQLERPNSKDDEEKSTT